MDKLYLPGHFPLLIASTIGLTHHSLPILARRRRPGRDGPAPWRPPAEGPRAHARSGDRAEPRPAARGDRRRGDRRRAAHRGGRRDRVPHRPLAARPSYILPPARLTPL